MRRGRVHVRVDAAQQERVGVVSEQGRLVVGKVAGVLGSLEADLGPVEGLQQCHRWVEAPRPVGLVAERGETGAWGHRWGIVLGWLAEPGHRVELRVRVRILGVWRDLHRYGGGGRGTPKLTSRPTGTVSLTLRLGSGSRATTPEKAS